MKKGSLSEVAMSKPLSILVVDDDRSIAKWLKSVLAAEGYRCQTAHSPEEAEALLHQERFDITLVDIYLRESSGLDFIKRVKELQAECNCVMMTAHASVETVARSVNEGAVEYLGKPLKIDDLLSLVKRLGDRDSTGTSEAPPAVLFSPPTSIVGRSPKMLDVYRGIARVAASEATVLITGASGTGKELVARAVHEHSRRAAMPFVPINCGAVSETLLESELFGHEKGAFTGADRSRRGLIETAGGGTLFLDEITETSNMIQVKLLRVLQEGQVRPLGSNTIIPLDVRVLAASNQDVDALVQAGHFREDLYYRLAVVVIHLPSLDERREDIPLLVRHFLDDFNQRNQRHVSIRDSAVAALAGLPWPGNVRELENTVERLAIFSSFGEITASDVERGRPPLKTLGEPDARPAGTLQEMERRLILQAMRDADGNRSLAAKRLGIGRKSLYNKARRLNIDLGPEGS